MTQEEEHAIHLFITMVAELNDAQEAIDIGLKSGDVAKVAFLNWYNAWTDTFRCGESQKALNELALRLVDQQEV